MARPNFKDNTLPLSIKAINAIRQSRPRLEKIIEDLTPALTNRKAVLGLHVQVAEIKNLESLFPSSMRSIGISTDVRKQLKVAANVLESNRTAMADGVVKVRDIAGSTQGAIITLSSILKNLNNIEIPSEIAAMPIAQKATIKPKLNKLPVEAAEDKKFSSFQDLNFLIEQLKKDDNRIKMAEKATNTQPKNVASPAQERSIQRMVDEQLKPGNTKYNRIILDKKPWERQDLSPAANRARLEKENKNNPDKPNDFDLQADAQIKKVFGKIAASVKKIPKISGNGKPVFSKAPLFVSFQGYPPTEADFKKAAIIAHPVFPGVVLEDQLLIGVPLSIKKPAEVNKIVSDALDSLSFRIDDKLVNVATKTDKTDPDAKNTMHYASFSWKGSQFRYFWFMPRQQFNRLGRVAIKQIAIADPGQIFKQAPDANAPKEDTQDKIKRLRGAREQVKEQGDAEVAGLRFDMDKIVKEIEKYRDRVADMDREIESKNLILKQHLRKGDKRAAVKTKTELDDLELKKETMLKDIISPLRKQAKQLTENINAVFERLRKERSGK